MAPVPIMNSLAIAATVLACVFGGALAGLFLGRRLPHDHLGEDAKDIVKLGIGVIATMAALVLGLLISSAKSTFDKMSDEVTLTAAKVIQLDRALARYGPETKAIRSSLRRNYQTVVDALVSGEGSQLDELRASGANGAIEEVETAIRTLVPRSDPQRELRAQALTVAEDAGANRWLLLLQQHHSFSTPLVAVLVSWLTLIFVGFGLFSPRNGTIVAVLFLCALSVSSALFLIVEMDDPFGGMVRLSEVPMRRALSVLSSD